MSAKPRTPQSVVERIFKDSRTRKRLFAATSVLSLLTVVVTVGVLTFPAISISGSHEALQEQGVNITESENTVELFAEAAAETAQLVANRGEAVATSDAFVAGADAPADGVATPIEGTTIVAPEVATDAASAPEAAATEQGGAASASATSDADQAADAAVETDQATSSEAEQDAPAPVAPSARAERALQEADLASKRLIVGAETSEAAAALAADEHAVATFDGMYLLQYENEGEAAQGFLRYFDSASFVTPDVAVQIADDAGKENVDPQEEIISTNNIFTEEENPFAELEAALEVYEEEIEAAEKAQEEAAQNGGNLPALEEAKLLIALIDTGITTDAKDNANVVEGISVLGEAFIDDAGNPLPSYLDENGHGQRMADYIVEENADASILAIKALGKDGKGDISAVIAGINYAIERGASIINLSLCAYASDENAALSDAIRRAEEAGVVVVGAAGNQGYNARYYIPGNIEEAFVVGSADETGKRIEASNFGETVDYNVVSATTSEAAARMSGILSISGLDALANIINRGKVFATDYQPEIGEEEQANEEDPASEEESAKSDEPQEFDGVQVQEQIADNIISDTLYYQSDTENLTNRGSQKTYDRTGSDPKLSTLKDDAAKTAQTWDALAVLIAEVPENGIETTIVLENDLAAYYPITIPAGKNIRLISQSGSTKTLYADIDPQSGFDTMFNVATDATLTIDGVDLTTEQVESQVWKRDYRAASGVVHTYDDWMSGSSADVGTYNGYQYARIAGRNAHFNYGSYGSDPILIYLNDAVSNNAITKWWLLQLLYWDGNSYQLYGSGDAVPETTLLGSVGSMYTYILTPDGVTWTSTSTRLSNETYWERKWFADQNVGWNQATVWVEANVSEDNAHYLAAHDDDVEVKKLVKSVFAGDPEVTGVLGVKLLSKGTNADIKLIKTAGTVNIIDSHTDKTKIEVLDDGQLNEDTREANAIRVKKVDASDTSKTLSGAKFKLYKMEGSEKKYANFSNDNAFSSWGGEGTEVETGNDGIAIFRLLDAGTYYIEETSAPRGYEVSEEVIEVLIGSEGQMRTPGQSGIAALSLTNGVISVNSKQVDATADNENRDYYNMLYLQDVHGNPVTSIQDVKENGIYLISTYSRRLDGTSWYLWEPAGGGLGFRGSGSDAFINATWNDDAGKQMRWIAEIVDGKPALRNAKTGNYLAVKNNAVTTVAAETIGSDIRGGSVEFSDTRKLIPQLILDKTNKSTGELLTGATFTIRDKNSGESMTLTDANNDGRFEFDFADFENYSERTVYEIEESAPVGYVGISSAMEFTISPGGEITWHNQPAGVTAESVAHSGGGTVVYVEDELFEARDIARNEWNANTDVIVTPIRDENGNVIEGAQVTLYRHPADYSSDTSWENYKWYNADANKKLYLVAGEDYTITAKKNGYVIADYRFNVNAGTTKVAPGNGTWSFDGSTTVDYIVQNTKSDISHKSVRDRNNQSLSYDVFCMNRYNSMDNGGNFATRTVYSQDKTDGGGTNIVQAAILHNGQGNSSYTDDMFYMADQKEILFKYLRKALYYGYLGEWADLGVNLTDDERYAVTQDAIWQITHYGHAGQQGVGNLPKGGSDFVHSNEAALKELLQIVIWEYDQYPDPEGDLYVYWGPNGPTGKAQNLIGASFGSVAQKVTTTGISAAGATSGIGKITVPNKEKVFPTLTLNKIDEEGNALSSATFTIYKKGEAAGYTLAKSDGTYTFDFKEFEDYTETTTYVIKETTPPDYMPLDSDIEFMISPSGNVTWVNKPSGVVQVNSTGGSIGSGSDGSEETTETTYEHVESDNFQPVDIPTSAWNADTEVVMTPIKDVDGNVIEGAQVTLIRIPAFDPNARWENYKWYNTNANKTLTLVAGEDYIITAKKDGYIIPDVRFTVQAAGTIVLDNGEGYTPQKHATGAAKNPVKVNYHQGTTKESGGYSNKSVTFANGVTEQVFCGASAKDAEDGFFATRTLWNADLPASPAETGAVWSGSYITQDMQNTYWRWLDRVAYLYSYDYKQRDSSANGTLSSGQSVLTGWALRDAVQKVLYNGYPYNAAGFSDTASLRKTTQEALFYVLKYGYEYQQGHVDLSTGSYRSFANVEMFDALVNYALKGQSASTIKGQAANKPLTFQNYPSDTETYVYWYTTTGPDGEGVPNLTSQPLIGIYAPSMKQSVTASGYKADAPVIEGGEAESGSGSITVLNERVKFPELQLKKVDEEGNPLAGAGFTIREQDGTVDQALTGNDGIFEIDFSNLGLENSYSPDTTYVIRESNSPAGYEVLGSEIAFKISRTGEVTWISKPSDVYDIRTVSESVVTVGGNSGNTGSTSTVEHVEADDFRPFNYEKEDWGQNTKVNFAPIRDESGAVINGAQVTLTRLSKNNTNAQWYNTSSNYELTLIAGESYRLSAVKDGYEIDPIEFTVNASSAKTVPGNGTWSFDGTTTVNYLKGTGNLETSHKQVRDQNNTSLVYDVFCMNRADGMDNTGNHATRTVYGQNATDGGGTNIVFSAILHNGIQRSDYYDVMFTQDAQKGILFKYLRKALYYGYLGQKADLGVYGEDLYQVTQTVIWQITHFGYAGQKSRYNLPMGGSYFVRGNEAAINKLLDIVIWDYEQYPDPDGDLYIYWGPTDAGGKAQNLIGASFGSTQEFITSGKKVVSPDKPVNEEEIITVTGSTVITVPNSKKEISVDVFKRDSTTGDYLTGATFALYKRGEGESYTKVAEKTTTSVTDPLNFGNLQAGEYYIQEIAAPTGYKLISDRIRFSIDVNGVMTQYGTNGQVDVDNNGALSVGGKNLYVASAPNSPVKLDPSGANQLYIRKIEPKSGITEPDNGNNDSIYTDVGRATSLENDGIYLIGTDDDSGFIWDDNQDRGLLMRESHLFSNAVWNDANGRKTRWVAEELTDVPSSPLVLRNQYDANKYLAVTINDQGQSEIKLVDRVTLVESMSLASSTSRSITVNNKPLVVEVLKVNKDTQAPIANVPFTLRGGDSDVTKHTDSEGKAAFDNLNPNTTYTIQEDTAPEGYIGYEGEVAFMLADDGNIQLLGQTDDIGVNENGYLTIGGQVIYAAPGAYDASENLSYEATPENVITTNGPGEGLRPLVLRNVNAGGSVDATTSVTELVEGNTYAITDGDNHYFQARRRVDNKSWDHSRPRFYNGYLVRGDFQWVYKELNGIKVLATDEYIQGEVIPGAVLYVDSGELRLASNHSDSISEKILFKDSVINAEALESDDATVRITVPNQAKTQAVIEAQKELLDNGQRVAISANAFEFKLEPKSGRLDGANADMPIVEIPMPHTAAGATAATTMNTAANMGEMAAVSFNPITFTQPGTYTYIISELEGSNTDMNYDKSKYEATVTVVRGADGKLQTPTVAYRIVQDENGAAVIDSMSTPTSPSFVNSGVQAWSVKLYKTDNDATNPTALAGATFALYTAADYGNGSNPQNARRIEGDREGAELSTFEWGDLVAGTYYIVEEEAPRGYAKLDKPVCFTISETGAASSKTATIALEGSNNPAGVAIVTGSELALTAKNAPLDFELEFKKVDSQATMVGLSGAQFTLTPLKIDATNSSVSVSSLVKDTADAANTKSVSATPGNGVFTISGLTHEGWYVLEETKAPDGYMRSTTPWFVKTEFNLVDGEWLPVYEVYHTQTVTERGKEGTYFAIDDTFYQTTGEKIAFSSDNSEGEDEINVVLIENNKLYDFTLLKGNDLDTDFRAAINDGSVDGAEEASAAQSDGMKLTGAVFTLQDITPENHAYYQYHTVDGTKSGAYSVNKYYAYHDGAWTWVADSTNAKLAVDERGALGVTISGLYPGVYKLTEIASPTSGGYETVAEGSDSKFWNIEIAVDGTIEHRTSSGSDRNLITIHTGDGSNIVGITNVPKTYTLPSTGGVGVVPFALLALLAFTFALSRLKRPLRVWQE